MFLVPWIPNSRHFCIGGKRPFRLEHDSNIVFVLDRSYAGLQPKPTRILGFPGVANPNDSTRRKFTKSISNDAPFDEREKNWTPVSTLYHPRIVWSIWSSDCVCSFHQNTWNCLIELYKYDFDKWRHISCDDTRDVRVCFWVTLCSWHLSECDDCAFLSLKGSIVVFVLDQSYAGLQPKSTCILGFPGVTNPNNSTRKNLFLKTISHHSTWNTHDWNFDPDISLAWSGHEGLYNVLLWHMFSGSLSHAMAWIALNNVFLYMTWACTECAPDPTHSSVYHTPWFLLSTVVELIDCLVHVWLGFLCP